MKSAMWLAVAAAALSTGADAAVTVIGNSLARTCYESARAKSAGAASIANCDAAFRNDVLTPDDRVATFVNRGVLRSLSGDLPGAVADYDAALALDPDEPEAWLNKAFAYLRGGDGVRALPMFDTAVSKNTGEPALAHFGRAIAHEEVGNVRAAYADYRRALALAPKWSLPATELQRFKVGGR